MRPAFHTWPAKGWYLLLTAVPLGLGLLYALLYSVELVGLTAQGFSLRHWSTVLSDGEIWFSLGYSLYIATAAMLIAIATSLFLAVRWRTDFQRGPLSIMIYFPLALPAMVVAYLAIQMLSKSGLLSRIAVGLGWINDLAEFPDLIQDQWAIGIILAHAAMAIPFLTLIFLNTYESERLDDLGEMASSLGAEIKAIRRRILMPVILKRNFPTLMLYFIFVLGSYEIPLLIGRQYPQMVSVLAVRKLQRYNVADRPEAYIIALIYACIVLGSMFWLMRKRIQSTS